MSGLFYGNEKRKNAGVSVRVAMGVEYNGNGYNGWQRVDNGLAVQELLEKAISRVGAEKISVVCAGRTDARVHAQGQVVHFDPVNQREAYSWVSGVNANLPFDISVCWAREVAETFHARFGAFSRSYRYVIHNRAARSALLHKRVTPIRYPLNAQLMHEAAQAMLGKHDFTSFRAQGCQAHSPVRNISSISVTRSGEFIYLDISANAFLYHMVRNIAGVLIAIGREEKPVGWVSELLQICDRKVGGVTAPPFGLYLVRAEYPEEFSIPSDISPISFG